MPLSNAAEDEEDEEAFHNERTPLTGPSQGVSSARSSFLSDYFSSSDDGEGDDEEEEEEEEEAKDDVDWEVGGRRNHSEMRHADRLSRRLLAVDDSDQVELDRVLNKSLRLNRPLGSENGEAELVGFLDRRGSADITTASEAAAATAAAVRSSPRIPYSSPRLGRLRSTSVGRFSSRNSGRFRNMLDDALLESQEKARRKILCMLSVALGCILLVIIFAYYQVRVAQPPLQPVGAYKLLERQEGEDFFKAYEFYEGPDSAGSNGYNSYVSHVRAKVLGIVNVTYEDDILDVYGRRRRRRTRENTDDNLNGEESDQGKRTSPISEPFVYMGTAPTADGPRDSIRLEGIRRFNRGLFIIDVRHMPAGCGVWPAFWLTDEANWPINGEIDIVEGVNFQSEAKTALHSTNGCDMFDIPLGTMTGGWDTAQGIPDRDTGVPDKILRYAQNCFVYDPHQWLNQGCVAVDLEGGTLGAPLNEKGGGVFVLEWDPINRHIRSWVFSPHERVPENLVEAIRTAHLPALERVAPDPQQWPLPYGFFAIGIGTACPSDHFKQMRIVFNTAFCGSVAGNRYFMDCPRQFQEHPTCNEWIQSEPDELSEAYWKIRGVYVYEREWERKLL